MLDGMFKHRAGPAETVAGIEQAVDVRSVPRPLLDLVEIVQVGDQRIPPVRNTPFLSKLDRRPSTPILRVAPELFETVGPVRTREHQRTTKSRDILISFSRL